MVAVFTEAVAHSGALIAQGKQVVVGGAGLGILMVVAGDQGDVVDAVHDLVGTHGDGVEVQHEVLQQVGVLAELHHGVQVQDGHAGLVIEIPDHGADGHVGRAMEADIDLALEAQAQQAPGDGAQVVDALADTDLHSAAAGGSGTGVEIGKAGEHQTVAAFCHLQGVGFADDGFAVQGEAAVHFGGAHGDDDDVIAGEVILNLAVQHFAKDTGTHFH